jgi:hypothetical protein
LVFINSPDAPRGKIARRVRARLGPFRVEHVDLQHGDQPLKVRVRLCVPIHVQPGDLVFINSPDAPRGKIARRVRARLGPFRVEHVDLQHGDQPLKVRVRLCVPIVGMSDEPLTVFVRDLTPCGSLPDLDPFGSVLPPSGFLVADLDPQRSQAAFDQLHTIFEQGLSIEERAHVRSLRARAVAASSTVGGRRLAGEPEQPWVPQAAPPQWMHEEWDGGLQDVPVDAEEHDDDFADDRGYGASSDEDDDVDDKWDDAQSEWDGDSDGDSADVGARAPVVQLSSPGLGSGMSSFDGIIEELSRVPSPEEEDIEDTQGVRRGPVLECAVSSNDTKRFSHWACAPVREGE